MLPQIIVSSEVTLPDNSQWYNRFTIKSETSDRIYTIAQNRKKGFWACDCPGWKRYRRCKHLTAMGLPNHEQPLIVEFKKQ